MPPHARLPLHPIATFSGMLLFISAVAAYPRINIDRSADATTITYRHIKTPKTNPPPTDPGLIISSDPLRKDSSPSQRISREDLTNEWIFDTGATTHVCTNEALMHSTTSFAHSPLAQAVGHFGPNPVPVKGIGDVTLDLFSNSPHESSSIINAVGLRGVSRGRLTIHNVSYIPKAGVNLISWSQLKRARGMKLGLREGKDGGLEIWEVDRREMIMRFVLRDGLYFLDQGGREGGV